LGFPRWIKLRNVSTKLWIYHRIYKSLVLKSVSDRCRCNEAWSGLLGSLLGNKSGNDTLDVFTRGWVWVSTKTSIWRFAWQHEYGPGP
jgi:hypothetical protein